MTELQLPWKIYFYFQRQEQRKPPYALAENRNCPSAFISEPQQREAASGASSLLELRVTDSGTAISPFAKGLPQSSLRVRVGSERTRHAYLTLRSDA